MAKTKQKPPPREYEIHRLALEVPTMTGDEFEALLADMREHGWDPDRPAVLYQGQIIDGRHRYQASRDLGTTPVVVDRTARIDESGGPAAYVLSQLTRRNLTASQAAAVAVRLMPELREQGRERMAEGARSGKVATPSRSREQAAALVGCSPRYVQDALAIEKADPELLSRVRGGELSLPEAKQRIAPAANEPPTKPKAAEPLRQGMTVGALLDQAEKLSAADRFALAAQLKTIVSNENREKIDTDSWCTPAEIVDTAVGFLGLVDLDPATNEHSIVGATTKWTKADDALARDWTAVEVDGARLTIWLNPPYSGPGPFLQRLAAAVADYGDADGLALIKGDWSTKWWQSYVDDCASAVCYLKDRPRYLYEGKPRGTGEFPAAVVYYGDRPDDFRHAFEQLGRVEILRDASEVPADWKGWPA